MEQSSSGRLKKMGFEPKATKTLDSETPEEKEVEAREISDVSEEISETTKLRLARTPTQVEIDFPDGMECPSCKENLGLGAIICMACEINVQTGKKLKSKVKKGRNAYAAPKDSTNDLPNDIDCGGIGRGKYWLYTIIFTIIAQGISYAITGPTNIDNADPYAQFTGAKGVAIIGLGILSLIVGIILQVGRLRNLGMSGWRYLQQFIIIIAGICAAMHWSLGLIVGVISLFVLLRYYYWILVCPSGYEDHRTLDKNGKILLGFLIVLFLLTIVGGGFIFYTIMNEVSH